MKVIGIGNAIVDVICKVDDEFLTKNDLTKSNMKLIDETEFQKLLANLKIEETVSGGSVANSIVGLSQLGNKVGFIGKVNEEDLGKKYEKNSMLDFAHQNLRLRRYSHIFHPTRKKSKRGSVVHHLLRLF